MGMDSVNLWWGKHIFFYDGKVPLAWREMICPLLNKPSLKPEDLNNCKYCVIKKMLEKILLIQLQIFMEETNFLFFQPGFLPNFGTERGKVILMNNLLQERSNGNVTILILLDFSAAFDKNNHYGVLLDCLHELCYGCSAPICLNSPRHFCRHFILQHNSWEVGTRGSLFVMQGETYGSTDLPKSGVSQLKL